MGSKLFVGGLSWNTTDASLRSAFESFGQIREARVILDRETGKSRGFGFVSFNKDEDAANAIRSMNGAVVDGRTIRVNEAEERRPGSGPGGGGGGGGGGYGGGGDRGDRPPRRDFGDRGPRPEVHTRGRPPFRGDGGPGGGDRGPRPGGWSPAPSFRAPPPPGPGEGGDWGEDRKSRQDRRQRTKKPNAPATGTWEDDMRTRAPLKREKRESGKSWRDYTADEDFEDDGSVPDKASDAEGGETAEGGGEE